MKTDMFQNDSKKLELGMNKLKLTEDKNNIKWYDPARTGLRFDDPSRHRPLLWTKTQAGFKASKEKTLETFKKETYMT